jgi:hypothetical protein
MKKNLIPVLVSLGSLFTSLLPIQAMAELSPELVNKYHRGDFYFDGANVKNPFGSKVNFDKKNKLVESKGSKNSTYRMTWGNEEIDNSSVLTVTEAELTSLGEITKVDSRTSTFSADKLRSSTICYGNAQKKSLGLSKTAMKCVTATKRSCARMMEIYGKESQKNGLLKDSEQTAKAAQECSSVLKSYEAMAKAFGNQSFQVEGRHNDVIDGDTARVKAFVDQSTGSKFWDPTNIGTMTKSSDLDEMARGYASSIEGMQALTKALEICADASADFKEEGNSSSGTSTAPKTNGTAQ